MLDVNEAIELLKNPEMKYKDVAEIMGFSANYIIKQVKIELAKQGKPNREELLIAMREKVIEIYVADNSKSSEDIAVELGYGLMRRSISQIILNYRKEYKLGRYERHIDIQQVADLFFKEKKTYDQIASVTGYHSLSVAKVVRTYAKKNNLTFNIRKKQFDIEKAVKMYEVGGLMIHEVALLLDFGKGITGKHLGKYYGHIDSDNKPDLEVVKRWIKQGKSVEQISKRFGFTLERVNEFIKASKLG